MFYTTNEVRRSLWMMTSHLQIISKQAARHALLAICNDLVGWRQDPGIVPSLTGTKVCRFHPWAKQHLDKVETVVILKESWSCSCLYFVSIPLGALGDDRSI